MATLDERIPQDEQFFELLFDYAHPNAPSGMKEYLLKNHLLTGEIQIESMMENAIEKVGGPKKISKYGMDFDDFSDAKKSCVRSRANGRLYDGAITGITTKLGTLRVMMYERKQNKFYYFVIPFDAHHEYKYIEVPFTIDGEPKRKNKWWKYEVKNFEEMATSGIKWDTISK